MKFKMKTAYVATMLALGGYANAERMIVTFDENFNNKSASLVGQKVLARDKNWIAIDVDEQGKSSLRNMNGFKSMEVDAKRYPVDHTVHT